MDRNKIVESLAGASTKNIPGQWKFQAMGKFIVNDQDTDSYVGELWYQNGEYEIGPALKVRDWVFCLERRREESRKALKLSDDWVVSAFRGPDHFSFNYRVPDKIGNRNVEFMRYICCSFWPILHPETFDHLDFDKMPKDKMIQMEFKCEFFKPQGDRSGLD